MEATACSANARPYPQRYGILRRLSARTRGPCLAAIANIHRFDKILNDKLVNEGLARPEELDSKALRELNDAFNECFIANTAQELTVEPRSQLRASIEAVVKSWTSELAKAYRALEGPSDIMGTATTVQMVVFGNVGPTSRSGVGFTRSPRRRQQGTLYRLPFQRPG
jgi:hypothetical protein